MFDLLKRLKNQEVENVAEKNEDVSVMSTSAFPTAEDTLKVTKQKWKEITAAEIIEKIKYESSRGNREARFYDSYISDELKKELTAQGYRIEIKKTDSSTGCPYFYIYW